MRETVKQNGRLPGGLADMVVQELLGLVHDLFVVVELIAANTWACLKDGGAVVVPFEASIWLVPIHGPAEICRIDVCCESVLVAVQLVADEVHFAAQNAFIAGLAQVVGVRWRILGDRRRIVVCTNPGWQLSRNHGHPRGSTKRRVAIRRLEDNRFLGQLVKIRRLDLRVLVVDLQLRCRKLVGHDVQNVGLGLEERRGVFTLALQSHRWRDRGSLWKLLPQALQGIHPDGSSFGRRRRCWSVLAEAQVNRTLERVCRLVGGQ